MFGYVYRPTSIRMVAVAALLAALAGPATAVPAVPGLKVTGWANPPVGHLGFCQSFPQECVSRGPTGPMRLNSKTWAALNQVNTSVNHDVEPATDLDVYQTDEVWTLPGVAGDCEDYVLLKRKRLVAQGWPTSALSVAVVFDEVGDGHAVLLARTTSGDLVLDNKTDRIRLWSETGYLFVKRQSDSDPRRWVSVGNPNITSRSTAAPH